MYITRNTAGLRSKVKSRRVVCGCVEGVCCVPAGAPAAALSVCRVPRAVHTTEYCTVQYNSPIPHLSRAESITPGHAAIN